MAEFGVYVVEVRTVEPIEGADVIEAVVIGDYRSITKKGECSPGDLVAYVPEGAVVPVGILQMLGLEGRLAGKDHNRVKAIKLRGTLSQGLVIPTVRTLSTTGKKRVLRYNDDVGESHTLVVSEGDDVALMLNIVKYEPPIPTQLAGEVYNAGTEITVNYDVENLKKYPDVFLDEEPVQITEKIHGTNCQLIYIPHSFTSGANDEHKKGPIYGDFAIASKGLGGQGLCFKWNEKNVNNAYQRAVVPLIQSITNYFNAAGNTITDPIQIFGEVFGSGIQDLTYGLKGNVDFRIFDIHVGARGQGRYLNDAELDFFCTATEVQRVPVLYRGPYSKQIVDEHSQHAKSVFDPTQISEGVVIKPITERYHPTCGRVALKSVNEAYLLRKGDVTEFS